MNIEILKNTLFFGNEGITSTSANYVANIAKEIIREDLATLKSCGFVTEVVTMFDGSCSNVIKKGMTEQQLDRTLPTLERVVRMKSLIGWLREAIKSKEEMMELVSKLPETDVYKILGMAEEYEKLKEPCLATVTEEDIIAKLDPAERRKMELCKTRAAILGKFIHEDGEFSKARKEVCSCEGKPKELERAFNTMVLHSFEPSLSIEKVNDVYFKAQREQREAQAELNAILFKIKEQLFAEKTRLLSEHKANRDAYAEQLKRYSLAVKEWREKEHNRISNLKIIIPAELKDIYDEVCEVGKKK